MLTVYHNVNPITNNIQRDGLHNLNNVLNENVNVTKWTSIVDNLCLLQQYKLMEHNQNTIPWLVINVPYGSIFVTIPDFFISHWKTGCCWEVILPVDDTLYSGHFNCHCRAVQQRVNVWTVRRDKKVVIVQYYIKVQRIKWLPNCHNQILVMHTTFQGFKLIPGHQGERRKS